MSMETTMDSSNKALLTWSAISVEAQRSQNSHTCKQEWRLHHMPTEAKKRTFHASSEVMLPSHQNCQKNRNLNKIQKLMT
jgi:hypothetical protein